MKKILLSVFAAASLSAAAQDAISGTSFFEDFNTAGPTTDGTYSAYWWGKENLGADASCAATEPDKSLCENFAVARTRSGNGDLELSVTQPENGWTPIGFGLQNGDNTAWPDISSSNSVSVSLTNEGSAGIEVYFSFISNGTTGATAKLATADGTTGSPFGGVVAAGAKFEKTFDLSNAMKHTWMDVNDPAKVTECTNKGGTIKGSYCLENKGFSTAAISGVEFSINGAGATVNGVWVQPAITNHPVKIHYIKSGTTVSKEEIVANQVSVYPNPATDVLNVKFESTTSTTVSIADITGKTVLYQVGTVGNNALTFSTAQVKAGIYFVNIQSVNGNLTQKVVIK